MSDFSERTFLTDSKAHPIRYLWTDAYAVCNFLELFRLTHEKKYLGDAITLVNQVHYTLGRYAKDDLSEGWISGLSEEEGSKHPTIGGLRIGKKLKERQPGDPYDEELEWERDGQYFHYLTKWMHALNCMSLVTGDFNYARLAIELAKTASAKFTYKGSPNKQKRMVWKMSIDLSRPLVTSMGQHDALDAFIVYHQLLCVVQEDTTHQYHCALQQEITQMKDICKSITWVTSDSLGIGGLLDDALKLLQLIIYHKLPHEEMLIKILSAVQEGLSTFMQTEALTYPAKHRLAFRELGLSIGLHALAKMQKLLKENPDFLIQLKSANSQIETLAHYIPLIQSIEEFWLSRENQQTLLWKEHININSMMLATSLFPDSYLMPI